MNELGLLWQSDTITPAHEHFRYLLNKIIINTEKQILKANQTDKVLCYLSYE
jgi:hypothetical protein